MTFTINDVKDIPKLLAALRLMMSGEFKVSKNLLEQVVQRLQKFANENGASIKVISPGGERVFEVTAKGIVIGASIGFYFGNITGAIIGAGIGGVIGYAKAHFVIEMRTYSDEEYVIFRTA